MRCNTKSFVIEIAALLSISSLAGCDCLAGCDRSEWNGDRVNFWPIPSLPSSHERHGLNRASVQAVSQKTVSQEVLSPLTDEERALDPHELILNQPDFAADLTFFRSERRSGGGGSEHVARKGRRYRRESEFWIFVGESGKPSVRLFPVDRTYDDLLPARYESADSSEPFNPKTLALETGVTYTVLGATTIDGYRCIKIKAIRKERPKEVYLYAARDLRNLVIVAQVLEPERSFVQKLRNVSFEVPDALVEIPPDYKPIEHDRWTKVETARIAYKGKPSRDYGVFRSPGGELFVWINDAPYPWTYLIRPQEAIVETAFQGLLVTRAGKYVLHTSETEAFSRTSYREKKRQVNTPEREKRVTVGKNSLKFRSNNYDEDRAMIEVRW